MEQFYIQSPKGTLLGRIGGEKERKGDGFYREGKAIPKFKT
jgi:hypothetical protein